MLRPGTHSSSWFGDVRFQIVRPHSAWFRVVRFRVAQVPAASGSLRPVRACSARPCSSAPSAGPPGGGVADSVRLVTLGLASVARLVPPTSWALHLAHPLGPLRLPGRPLRVARSARMFRSLAIPARLGRPGLRCAFAGPTVSPPTRTPTRLVRGCRLRPARGTPDRHHAGTAAHPERPPKPTPYPAETPHRPPAKHPGHAPPRDPATRKGCASPTSQCVIGVK